MDMPSFLLNRFSVRAFNRLYYATHGDAQGKLVDYPSFFFPLDSINNWNRLYGRRRFVQYQAAFGPESAAAGTTNAALTGYLIRHGIVRANGDGRIAVQAEQGHEINRPSSIRSVAFVENDGIARLQVGGVATKVADGALHL